MKLKVKIDELNETTRIKKYANVLLVYSHLQVFGIILVYKQIEYSLVSPLIPRTLTCEIYGQYVNGGILIATGFLIMLIFKLYHQNFWVLAIGILNLVVYNVFTFIN